MHAAVLTSSISTRRIAKMNVDVSERTHRAFFVAWFKGLLTKRALWEAQCILQNLLYVLPWEECNSLISLFMDAAEAIGFTTEPVLERVKTNDGFTRFFAFPPLSLLYTTYAIDPYIPNKHLTTL